MRTLQLIMLACIPFLFGCGGGNKADRKDASGPPEMKIIEEEILYSPGDSLYLFIAWHQDISDPRPAIVHMHGGGWKQGKPSKGTARRWAEEGYVGISIRYRLSHEAVFPAAVHDCKTAIRWARAHAGKYGIDPERIGVFGGSAGGHLAALTGLSGGDPFLEGEGLYPEYSSSVQAVAENYGPTDFLLMNSEPGRMDHDAPDSPESLFIGGPIQENKEMVLLANPINYVDPDDPPVLMIHGKNDMSVPFNQSVILFDALEKAGVVAKLVPVENGGHGFKPEPKDSIISPSKDEIKALQSAWFREHLRK